MFETGVNRRQGLKWIAGAGAALVAARTGALAQAPAPAAQPFSLPPLGYDYGALEPHIDATTMRIHHGAHHKAYVDNLNRIAAQWPQLAGQPIEPLLTNIASAPEAVRVGVRNNLGGHWNHTYFWELMTPGGAKAPGGDLLSAINGAFGSLDGLKEKVNQAGLSRFGSGWAWLSRGRDGKLAVFSTANQDTPHMETGAQGAVLGVDVWEHAYYLKHQSRRADYLRDWWNTVNWDKASANFSKLMG